MKFWCISIILLCYLQSFAQYNPTVSIRGILLDDEKQPVKNAVCFLKINDHIGVISSENGSFLLEFPRALLYDTLILSSLAFHKISIPLSKIDSRLDPIEITMKERTLVLDELVIEGKGDDIKKIVLNSIAKISSNYPKRTHQLKGHYRKVSTEKKQFTYLEEAVVLVEDHDYKDFQKPPKIDVIAYRKSKDWGKIDTLMVKVIDKIGDKAVKDFNVSRNPLYQLFESNYIRNYDKDGTHFNFESLKEFIDDRYKFAIVDIIYSEKDTILHVAFDEGPFPKTPSGSSYLKINSKDLAIIEFQLSTGFKSDNLLNQVLVKFRKIENCYYPYYIKTIKPRYINREIDDDEYDIEVYQFDEIKTKEFKKIKNRESIDRFDIMSHRQNIYDFEFWRSIENSNKYPLEEGIQISLEKHQSLDEQFKETINQ